MDKYVSDAKGYNEMTLSDLEPREILAYHKIIVTARGQVKTAKVKINALNER